MEKRTKTRGTRACPFCGANRGIYEETFRLVRCDNCGAEGPSDGGRRRAIMKWNGDFYGVKDKPEQE